MNNERYHSVKPGEVILHSKDPIAVEYRRELTDYLSMYPRGKDRNDLKQRLRSYTESGFYSACFELFLYSLLSSRAEKVIPHPVLPNISTHPEFEIVHDSREFFLEATLALDSEEYQAQEQRLRELVDAVRDVSGDVLLWAQPATYLPSDFPLDTVHDFLVREVDKLSAAATQLPRTLTFETVFNGHSVVIDFEVMEVNQEGTESVVQAWGSPEAKAVTTHRRIRRRVSAKAGKYGEMTIPYIIAVWPRTEFLLDRETAVTALYGDRQVHLSRKSGAIVGESRAWNGAFNTLVKGNLLNRQVSAVGLYRERFSISSYNRELYVYHNPYALNPIPEQLFSDLPQWVPRKNEGGDAVMQWLSGADPWGE
jgi:hypothetical protein